MLLQGSTVARQASEKEKAKDLPTFKDNDFLNEGAIIHIGKDEKDKLMATLQADVEVGSVLSRAANQRAPTLVQSQVAALWSHVCVVVVVQENPTPTWF